MAERPTVAEMRDRFTQCAQHYGSTIPRDAGLVWDRYIAALLEWGLISPADHSELSDLLPKVTDNPVLGVFLGWDQDAAPGTSLGSTGE